MKKAWLTWPAGLWCLLAASMPALAGGFSVSPVSLEFAPADKAQALMLNNSGARAVNAQLRVFAWTQVEGDDVLVPSGDILISPPMTQLAPGQQQLVRVLRTQPPGAGREQAYRIVVDELPSTTPPPGAPVSGLSFVLSYSLPVFLLPSGAPPVAEARWSLLANPATADTPFTLQADNISAAHVQLADLALLDAGGKLLHEQTGLVGYALAGTRREWPLNGSGASLRGATQLRARINGQVQTLRLSDASPGTVRR